MVIFIVNVMHRKVDVGPTSSFCPMLRAQLLTIDCQHRSKQCYSLYFWCMIYLWYSVKQGICVGKITEITKCLTICKIVEVAVDLVCEMFYGDHLEWDVERREEVEVI